MKAVLRLERAVSVQSWRILATVARSTQREWEPAVLKLAVEHDGLTPKLVAAELLGGRHAIARRLVDLCERLHLLELRGEVWRATEEGRLAAATGQVLVSERGSWTVWTTGDPLFQHPIVGMSSWPDEPSAFEEKGREVSRAFRPLPEAITGVTGRVLDLPAGRLRSIRIEELGKEARGEPVTTGAEAKLRISWTCGPNERAPGQEVRRCRLTGTLDGEAVETELPPPARSHAEVWQSLLRHAGLESRWDVARDALRVPFVDTSDVERMQMVRAVKISGPRIEGLGRFDDTAVHPVELQARTPGDAVEWAQWRLLREIPPYATDAEIGAAHLRAAEPFKGMAGPCPTRAELARLARGRGEERPSPVFWWIQAPADWSLEKGCAS